MATTLDLANTNISKPEHINELGVSRETAIVLGQVLSVKTDVAKLNHRVGKKFSKLSQRLDTAEGRPATGRNEREGREGDVTDDEDGGGYVLDESSGAADGGVRGSSPEL